MASGHQNVEKSYQLAKERYAEWGVDVEQALARLANIAISLHCWQGDDVGGFERSGEEFGGGLAVTGNYLGKARTPDELRADLDKALSLIPGKHRLNLHASYAETGGKRVERTELDACYFQNWIAWAKQRGMGMDFNPTYFAHPKAADGFTLAHPDAGIRRFWVEHGIICRRIGAEIGKALGSPCVTNVWIPDGFKDIPVDRKAPRRWLAESLDAMFAEPLDPRHNLDAVEASCSGSVQKATSSARTSFIWATPSPARSCSAWTRAIFTPPESISDKISSVLMWLDEILLHVSRGVRWDSDHVVILTDELQAIAQELVRGDFLKRVHIGLDFFDASINRVAAWVIGTRCMLKALLIALLEPARQLRELRIAGELSPPAWLCWKRARRSPSASSGITTAPFGRAGRARLDGGNHATRNRSSANVARHGRLRDYVHMKGGRRV